MKNLSNELIEQIEILKQSEKLIVVEGKNDIKALSNLGINKTIEITGPLEIFVEDIVANNQDFKNMKSLKNVKFLKDVILLTDLDVEGKKLHIKLNHLFSQLGVRVDCDFRNFLHKKTKLRQIEKIDKYVERIEIIDNRK